MLKMIKNFVCGPMDLVDKFLLKMENKLLCIKAKDFAKRKKDIENEEDYNKIHYGRHIDHMHNQLVKILKNDTFPETIIMKVSDIENNFGSKGLLDGKLKPDEIPHILEFFKDSGFDITYDEGDRKFEFKIKYE